MKESFHHIVTALMVACSVASLVIVAKQNLFGAGGTRRPAVEKISDASQFASRGYILGDGRSPNKIVLFSDFQCPFCAKVMHVLDSLQESGTSVSVVLRHVPSVSHPRASLLASAFECGAAQAEPTALARALFSIANAATDSAIFDVAVSTGVADSAKFAVCMDSEEVRVVLRRDSLDAARLKVVGTPTLLIGDIRANGLPTPDSLAAYVQRIRGTHGSAAP